MTRINVVRLRRYGPVYGAPDAKGYRTRQGFTWLVEQRHPRYPRWSQLTVFCRILRSEASDGE